MFHFKADSLEFGVTTMALGERGEGEWKVKSNGGKR